MPKRNLLRLLTPRRCYGVGHGTNTWAEWRSALWRYASFAEMHDLREIGGFEQEFARTIGVAKAYSFGAGRMALYAILQALNIGPGDEVIIPAFTCVVVPNAILYRGAKPVYVDIDLRTFNIDASKVEAAITKKTKALYAQHSFGLICDVDALRQIGKRYQLPIIEDVGHALGASYHGQPAGSLTEAAYFTSDLTKIINTKLGGMATTNDFALAELLEKLQLRTPWIPWVLERRSLRSFLVEFPLCDPSVYWLGRLLCSLLQRAGFLFHFGDELALSKPTRPPYPARLSAFQAQLGRSQLRGLEGNIKHRRAIGLALEERIGWLGVALEEGARNHAFLRYSFLVKHQASFVERFAKHFDLSIWFTSVVHGRNHSLEKVYYRSGSCPAAEFAAQHIVNFPTHPRIKRDYLLGTVDRNLDFIRNEIVYPAEITESCVGLAV